MRRKELLIAGRRKRTQSSQWSHREACQRAFHVECASRATEIRRQELGRMGGPRVASDHACGWMHVAMAKGRQLQKGKLGGYRKVKLFPGQCCVLVVCAVPAARACLGARNPGGCRHMAARRSNKTSSQGKGSAANEGAASKLLFRVSVTNVEPWGVAVDGWRTGCSTKGKACGRRTWVRRQRKTSRFSRGVIKSLRCFFFFEDQQQRDNQNRIGRGRKSLKVAATRNT